jgi:hypothetical protein
MTDRNSRQIYLQLTAQLYDLASKFSHAELRAARDVARAENNGMSIAAIDMLLSLHRAEAPKSTRPAADNHAYRLQEPEAKSENAERRRVRMLKEMLMSRELFANPSEIATSIPISLPLKPKESREKYVNRVLVRFRKLDSVKKQEFMDTLQAVMARASSSSFVSRWSRAIKDL